MKKKLFAALLGMMVLLQNMNFSSSSVIAAEKDKNIFKIDSNEKYEQEDRSMYSLVPTSNEYICSSKPIYLTCNNEEERKYNHGSIIRKEFEFTSRYDVEAYDITIVSCEGVDIIKEPSYEDTKSGSISFMLEFKVLDSYEFGNITFKVSTSKPDDLLADQTYVEQSIYCYHDIDYDYISTVSLDCLAEYSTKLQNYLQNIDRQGEYIESDIQNGETIKSINSRTDYSINVSGYISWTDYNDVVHPAQDLMVQIYTVIGSTPSIIGTAYTNASGAYSYTFPTDGTSKNIMIKVISQGTNVGVKNSSNSIYTYTSSIVTTSSFAKISYTASKLTDSGKSIGIQQAMALANNYIYSLESTLLSYVDVIYPYSGTSSCYNPSNDTIYIKQEDAFDWDVCHHEYGHYVQDCYNITDSPGGTHYINWNMADYWQNKGNGIKLAWGEGWATYFAINLQKEMSATYLNIPYVGDTYYTDIGTSINLDIEYLPNDYWLGEANEATVSAILYDMTDGYNSSEDDYVYFANDNIWNIVKTNNCTTLSDFIDDFYVAGFPLYSVLNMGSTLSRYISMTLQG